MGKELHLFIKTEIGKKLWDERKEAYELNERLGDELLEAEKNGNEELADQLYIKYENSYKSFLIAFDKFEAALEKFVEENPHIIPHVGIY